MDLSRQQPGFVKSTFDLIVSAPAVQMTVALEWYASRTFWSQTISGRIAGEVPPSAVLWCKASGLYSRDQFETEVSQTERAFDFGDVPLVFIS